MTPAHNTEGTAYSATGVVGGPDGRSDDERRTEELRQARDTVARLERKRSKVVQQLDDIEQALTEAVAARDDLEGGSE